MPGPEAPTATATATHVDIEPPDHRLPRDLHLELLLDVIFFGQPPAVRTGAGQRHVDDLVGLLFGQRTMGFGAVVLARFAARRFRVRLGRSFRERRRLPLAGPLGLFQQCGELPHLGLQGLDPQAQVPILFPPPFVLFAQPAVLVPQILVRRRRYGNYFRVLVPSRLSMPSATEPFGNRGEHDASCTAKLEG